MKSLYESLLDDDLLDNSDNIVQTQAIEELFKSFNKGHCKFKILKNGEVNINGDLIIKDYDRGSFPFINIKKVINGNVVIQNCKELTSLDGLFSAGATCSNFSISSCPKLASLVGGPQIVDGDFIVNNNPMISNLMGAPTTVTGSCYFHKNGKRFKENQISKYINVSRTINCSVEDEDEIITEDFNHPYLSELNKQLKKRGIDGQKSFKDIISRYKYIIPYLAWDKIDSSNITQIPVDNKALTLIRKLYSGSNLILFKNSKDEFIWTLCSENLMYIGPELSVDKYQRHNTRLPSRYKLNDIIHYCTRGIGITGTEHEMTRATSMIILGSPELSTYDLRQQRRASQEGIVKHGDEAYNKQVASRNKERYTKLLRELKLAKNKDVDIKLNERYSKVVERFLKANTEFIKNFSKFVESRYDMNYISDVMQSLMKLYNDYLSDYMDISAGKSYEYQTDEIEELKAKIQAKLDDAETRLSKIGF